MVKKLSLGFLLFGLLLMGGSHIFQEFLPITDSFRGFIDGFAVVLMLISLVYMILCKIMKSKLISG